MCDKFMVVSTSKRRKEARVPARKSLVLETRIFVSVRVIPEGLERGFWGPTVRLGRDGGGAGRQEKAVGWGRWRLCRNKAHWRLALVLGWTELRVEGGARMRMTPMTFLIFRGMGSMGDGG